MLDNTKKLNKLIIFLLNYYTIIDLIINLTINSIILIEKKVIINILILFL